MTSVDHRQMLSVDLCRLAIDRFYGEQVEVNDAQGGVVISLPLMYPDGIQVIVHVEYLTRSSALITDKGETLSRLYEQGLNISAQHTASLFEERKRVFELTQSGFELSKTISLPPNGLDIQLFAESLVSISHLIYRFEPITTIESPADLLLRKAFAERALTPQINFAVDGKIEKAIRVDYYVKSRAEFACEIVRRRGPMLGLMEQWAWRWTDIRAAHPRLITAMLYDPDKQDWDSTAIKLGNAVCDLFCPYFDTDRISAKLEKLA